MKKVETVTVTVSSLAHRMNVVSEYTAELMETLTDYINAGNKMPAHAGDLEEILLNGAGSWTLYSWTGCSLCWNSAIAARILTPQEFEEWRGQAYPSEWRGRNLLDLQADALRDAAEAIIRAYCAAV